jgi:hypothetical protein
MWGKIGVFIVIFFCFVSYSSHEAFRGLNRQYSEPAVRVSCYLTTSVVVRKTNFINIVD